MEKGVLLASGGIDSSVLMFQLAREKALDSVILCDYGQASADKQWGAVSGFARRLGVPARREAINWPNHARGRGYIFEDGKYPVPMQDAYEPVQMTPEEYQVYLDEKWDFIQGRNIVFLAYAGAWALSRRIGIVYTAFQFDAPEWGMGVLWSDTSPGFVDAFNAVSAAGGFSKRLEVRAPYLDERLTKQEIVRKGWNLRVPLYSTHSCEFYPACKSCHQCLIRKAVLRFEE
jgi:7-cyano-7-deazaguanine synthase in queuosine biosynthesis